MKNSFLKTITKTVAVALVFGLVGGAAFTGGTYMISAVTGSESDASSAVSDATQADASNVIQATNTTATVESTDVSGVVSEVIPSIVAITSMSEQEIMSYFGQGQTFETESAGSGIIIKQDDTYLYIVTNNHVISGTTDLTVQFSDETTAPAVVRGTDASNDLAVIQVALSDLSAETLASIKVATLGDSTSLNVGDGAIAIGNALGYGQSVTTGVISALNREVTFQDESTGATVTNTLIQTDAAINPGNSGGALINTSGEFIGINSSKYSDTSVEGMGFAIPMETAEPIIMDLIDNGTTTTAETPYIGIYGIDVTEDVAASYNMPQGVYVAQVISGSGAEVAGIVKGDIITSVNGTAVSSMEELKAAISEYAVGDTLTVTIQKADSGSYTQQELSVVLGSQNSENETAVTDDSTQEIPQTAPDQGNIAQP
ncbi:MAG: S1C family serine protease [Lachnospiraceae bacterium]